MSVMVSVRVRGREAQVTARQWSALAAFEIRQQLREPLTTLYALLFFLLAFGYTASGAVELVSERGAVAKDSPWALALAFGGLTAFGQVITTMVVATALLRDVALRTLPLIATSSVSPRIWFLSRLAAALTVLTLVYAAMPVGAFLGAWLGTGPGAQSAPGNETTVATNIVTYLATYLRLTVPTSLVVATVLASAALLTRRILGVLAAALALVGVWQLALALIASEPTRVLGALLDPFGNAPVLVISASWSAIERGEREVALAGLLLWNRLLWLSVATLLGAFAAWRASWPEPAPAPRPTVDPTRAWSDERLDGQATSALKALTGFTASWMSRDGGWRVVTLLAAVNATLNGWTRTPAVASGETILLLVSEHARLFLILLATVYAGELLWRERDTRVDALVDTTPIATRTLALGRIGGLFVAQLPVVLLLGAGALLVLVGHSVQPVAALGGAPRDGVASTFAAWWLFVLWLPFAQLTALALAVHAAVRHKVLAHLLLITGWVLAVVLDRHGATTWWYRFAEPAALAEQGVVAWGALATRAAWWSAISAILLAFTVTCWPRGQRMTGVRSTTSAAMRATSRR